MCGTQAAGWLGGGCVVAVRPRRWKRVRRRRRRGVRWWLRRSWWWWLLASLRSAVDSAVAAAAAVAAAVAAVAAAAAAAAAATATAGQGSRKVSSCMQAKIVLEWRHIFADVLFSMEVVIVVEKVVAPACLELATTLSTKTIVLLTLRSH